MITDNEKPKVECIGNQSFLADEANHTAIASWEDPTASDNSGNVFVTCDPPSGTIFPIGHTNVTCKAFDRSGNRAECSFEVYVINN